MVVKVDVPQKFETITNGVVGIVTSAIVKLLSDISKKFPPEALTMILHNAEGVFGTEIT